LEKQAVYSLVSAEPCMKRIVMRFGNANSLYFSELNVQTFHAFFPIVSWVSWL